MSFELPTSLSPSKVSTFKDCALKFRFSAIDKLPDPPGQAALKGTLVHRALQLMFRLPPPERNLGSALESLAVAGEEIIEEDDFIGLELDGDARAGFFSDAETMVNRYFELEDPTTFDPIGLELRLEAQVGDLTLRGIIDRLDLRADGELIVTDYKTGRVPNERQEQSRLGGVHFYSMLCERVFGKRPAAIQLMYLGPNPQIIVATPSEQSTRGLERKVGAIWTAVERACTNEDFRPKPSKLCDWCGYKAYCPSFGGDPALASSVAIDHPATPAHPHG